MTNPLFDLTGHVAIVTGTSRGLGQYFARALASSGADLVLTSRTLESLKPFEEEIAKLGRRAVPLVLDVRDPHSIEQMAAAAEATFGKIDILVNNAGMNIRKPALDVTLGGLECHPRYQFARQFLCGASCGEAHG